MNRIGRGCFGIYRRPYCYQAYVLLILTYKRMYRYAKSTNQLEKLGKIERIIMAYGRIERFMEARDLTVSISDEIFTQKLNGLLNKANNSK